MAVMKMQLAIPIINIFLVVGLGAAAVVECMDFRPEGRGQLNDATAQAALVRLLLSGRAISLVTDGVFYGVGELQRTQYRLTPTLVVNTLVYIYDVHRCYNMPAGVLIPGSQILEAANRVTRNYVVSYVRQGYGFLFASTGYDNEAFREAGLNLLFYYWIQGLYLTQPPPGLSDALPSTSPASRLHDRREMVNKSLGVGIPGHGCPPYHFALFTANYEVDMLASFHSPNNFPDTITSPSGRFSLVMQDDCNLVLYDTGPERTQMHVNWACGPQCFESGLNCYAWISLDGTFAVYYGEGTRLWYTPTQCTTSPSCWSSTSLQVQDAGNVVLYLVDTGAALWATNTVVCGNGDCRRASRLSRSKCTLLKYR